MIDDINKIKECPDCASMNIVYSISRDQIICKDCGLIFEPLAPEVEATFEKPHGVSSKGKKRGRPSKPKKASKKPSKKKRR